MIWPANLVTCALFNTLHSQSYSGIGNRGGMSRERFFLYAFIGSFCWYFFPGFLFQGAWRHYPSFCAPYRLMYALYSDLPALSYFNWVCWIAPNNVVVNQMFGYYSGLGMSLVTFDWSQIAYIGSPLATPWWAEANVAVGFVFFFCKRVTSCDSAFAELSSVGILTPILYYTNTWYAKYMPMSSRGSFDNTGKTYDVSKIINLGDSSLNLFKYQGYSPLFLSTTFAISYGLSFASITGEFYYSPVGFWSYAHDSV